MAEIVNHNFGKEEREFARTLGRLLKLVEDRDADILANPGKYLDMAGRQLAEQERFFYQLWEALHVPWMVSVAAPYVTWQPPAMFQPDTMQIDRRDYEAFQTLKRLIEARNINGADA